MTKTQRKAVFGAAAVALVAASTTAYVLLPKKDTATRTADFLLSDARKDLPSGLAAWPDRLLVMERGINEILQPSIVLFNHGDRPIRAAVQLRSFPAGEVVDGQAGEEWLQVDPRPVVLPPGGVEFVDVSARIPAGSKGVRRAYAVVVQSPVDGGEAPADEKRQAFAPPLVSITVRAGGG